MEWEARCRADLRWRFGARTRMGGWSAWVMEVGVCLRRPF